MKAVSMSDLPSFKPNLTFIIYHNLLFTILIFLQYITKPLFSALGFDMNLTKLIRGGPITYSNTFVRLGPNAVPPRVVSALRARPRHASTFEAKIAKKESLVKRLVEKIPFLNAKTYRIKAAGFMVYENVADKINYLDFFQQLGLPDTFYSWFTVTELHVYMIAARAMADGADGRLLRNSLLEAFWGDVSTRTKKLGGEVNPAVVRSQVQDLSGQLKAVLFAYDEGLASDDVILAGALWRRFYQQGDVQPVHLEILVKYIRKQMRLLDQIDLDTIVTTQKVDWVQLNN